MKKSWIGLSVLLGSCVFSVGVFAKVPPAAHGQTPKMLDTMHWHLVSIQAAKGKPSASLSGVPLKQYQLDITDGNFNVQGPCNGYFGPIQFAAKNKLSLGPVASTRMACPPPLMKADDELAKLLASVSSYRLQSGQLMLSSGSSVLTFRGTPSDQSIYGDPTTRFIELRKTAKGVQWRFVIYDSNAIQTNKNAPWSKTPFPGIRDFSPAANHEYIVRVNAYKDKKTGKELWVKDMIVLEGAL